MPSACADACASLRRSAMYSPSGSRPRLSPCTPLVTKSASTGSPSLRCSTSVAPGPMASSSGCGATTSTRPRYGGAVTGRATLGGGNGRLASLMPGVYAAPGPGSVDVAVAHREAPVGLGPLQLALGREGHDAQVEGRGLGRQPQRLQ